MNNYRVVFLGSAGVIPLEISRNHMSDQRAKEWLARVLPSYWPVYYDAAVYRVDDNDSSKLVVNYVSQVTVREV